MWYGFARKVSMQISHVHRTSSTTIPNARRDRVHRSSCADVDQYFGSMTSDTSVVDLGQTTRLECPNDEDTEIVIVGGHHLTVTSGLDVDEPVK